MSKLASLLNIGRTTARAMGAKGLLKNISYLGGQLGTLGGRKQLTKTALRASGNVFTRPNAFRKTAKFLGQGAYKIGTNRAVRVGIPAIGIPAAMAAGGVWGTARGMKDVLQMRRGRNAPPALSYGQHRNKQPGYGMHRTFRRGQR